MFVFIAVAVLYWLYHYVWWKSINWLIYPSNWMYQIKNCKQPPFFHKQLEKHEAEFSMPTWWSQSLLSPGCPSWISATAWLSLSNLLLTRVTNEEKIPRSYHNAFLRVDVCLPVIVHCGSLVETSTSRKTAHLDLSKCVSFLINDPCWGGVGMGLCGLIL